MIRIPDDKVRPGRINRLKVLTKAHAGVYLDGREYGEILMPRRFVPEDCEVGDFVNVFVYLDSEDRFVATKESPRAMAGELGYMQAVDVTPMGAFMDWGLPKDLLVPFREQLQRIYVREFHVVYVYFDEASQRLVGSTKVKKHINLNNMRYAPGDEVSLIVAGEFELGFNVIIDRLFLGVIYHTEIFRPIREGERLKGYIKQIRPDKKIDVELQKSGEIKKEALSGQIVDKLKSEGGFLPVTDKSPPEVIYDLFHVSKKVYKRAVGNLYKERIITIEDEGIRLNEIQ